MTAQGQGEVHIDWESIRPGAEVTGRAVVRFRPRPPWPVGAGPRDLLQAVDRARVTASEEMFEIVEVYEVAPSPDGPVLVIENGDPGEKRAWLTEVARMLAEDGWSGTVEQAPEPDSPAWTAVSGEWLTAFTAYSITGPAGVLSHPTWGVEPASTLSICRTLADWTLAQAGSDVHLHQGRSVIRPSSQDVLDGLVAGLDWSAEAALAVYRDDPPGARWTSLASHGQVMHTVVDSTCWAPPWVTTRVGFGVALTEDAWSSCWMSRLASR